MPADCGPYQWADIETMLQLIAALNLAFYTFKEIRQPGVNEVYKKLEDLPVLRRGQIDEIESYQLKIKTLVDQQSAATKTEIESESIKFIFHKSDLARISKAIKDVKLEFDGYLDKQLRFEPFLSELSLFTSVFSVITLLYATMNPKQSLNSTAALAMLLFGLTPVFVLLRINYRVFGKAKYYKKRADNIEGEINVIRMKADMILSDVEKLAMEKAPPAEP